MPTSPDIPTSHWEERACWDSSSAQTSTGRSLRRPLPTSGADGTCRFHSGYATICTSRCPRACVDGGQWGVFLSLALTFTGTGYLAWCRMELRCLRTNSRCHHFLRDEDHSISPQTESPIGKPLICHIIRRKDLPTFCCISDILPGKFHGRSVPLHQPPLLRRTLQLEGNEHRNAGPQQHCGRKRTRTDIGLRIFHVQA